MVDWIELGRALSGVIVVSGLVALSLAAVYNEGSGPALEVMVFYGSLALVLFGLKEGLYGGNNGQ